MYRVKTDDFGYGMFDVGEKVRLNKQDLYVRHALLSMEDSVIICSYTLSSKNAITAPKTYNRNITGLALAGIVQVVENDDVKLDLHIDYKPGTVQFFKYATDYSPESHTGWYVMPEVGDTVFLIFPTENEKDAHASSSMRQSGTGRTGDPLVKYLRTPFGKDVKLEEKEVLITAKDGETYIKINEDSGIEIYTLKPINVYTDNTMDVTSTGDMSVTTKANLSVATEANLYITAKDSINMSCGGNVIDIKPATGIAVTTDTELNTLSASDTNIESKTNMALTSGDDMMISSGKKLLESGKKAVVFTNMANVMAMEPLTGITIASAMKLNMASAGNAVLASSKGLNLAALRDLKTMAGTKHVQSGKAAVEVNCGGSSVKLGTGGVDIKGITIKEN
jgi:uncharacterized protein (DUF2345 family)